MLLTDIRVQMNGSELRLGGHDELPVLESTPEKSGRVSFAPVSITFLAIPDAHNPACNARAGRALIQQGLTETVVYAAQMPWRYVSLNFVCA